MYIFPMMGGFNADITISLNIGFFALAIISVVVMLSGFERKDELEEALKQKAK